MPAFPVFLLLPEVIKQIKSHPAVISGGKV
jgi:hypothetical protein